MAYILCPSCNRINDVPANGVAPMECADCFTYLINEPVQHGPIPPPTTPPAPTPPTPPAQPPVDPVLAAAAAQAAEIVRLQQENERLRAEAELADEAEAAGREDDDGGNGHQQPRPQPTSAPGIIKVWGGTPKAGYEGKVPSDRLSEVADTLGLAGDKPVRRAENQHYWGLRGYYTWGTMAIVVVLSLALWGAGIFDRPTMPTPIVQTQVVPPPVVLPPPAAVPPTPAITSCPYAGGYAQCVQVVGATLAVSPHNLRMVGAGVRSPNTAMSAAVSACKQACP